MTDSYEVVWPRSAQGVQAKPLAHRLDSLDGKRIAFLWDFMFRGEELFPVIEAELTKTFAGLEVVGYDEFGNTHGPDEHDVVEALPATLQSHHIDAVISGVGC